MLLRSHQTEGLQFLTIITSADAGLDWEMKLFDFVYAADGGGGGASLFCAIQGRGTWEHHCATQAEVLEGGVVWRDISDGLGRTRLCMSTHGMHCTCVRQTHSLCGVLAASSDMCAYCQGCSRDLSTFELCVFLRSNSRPLRKSAPQRKRVWCGLGLLGLGVLAVLYAQKTEGQYYFTRCVLLLP